MQEYYTMFKREAAERLFPPFCQETENRLKRLKTLGSDGGLNCEGIITPLFTESEGEA